MLVGYYFYAGWLFAVWWVVAFCSCFRIIIREFGVFAFLCVLILFVFYRFDYFVDGFIGGNFVVCVVGVGCLVILLL